MGSPKRSLTEHAETHPQQKGGHCWTCNIPERDEVDAGIRAGLMLGAILGWLLDPVEGCGYDRAIATRAKLDHHRKYGHVPA